MNLPGNYRNLFFQGRQAGQYYEMVILKTGNQLVRKIFPQHIGHSDEELIPFFTAITHIIQMKIMDIHIHQ